MEYTLLKMVHVGSAITAEAARQPIDSPIVFSARRSRALIGKCAGDSVEVQTPGGLRQYEILDVRYE